MVNAPIILRDRYLRGGTLSGRGVDTLHMALISHALYYYLVTSFGQIGVLAAPTW